MEIFPCYSVPLMKFLTNEKHINYKIVGLHPKSKKTFYVFVEDEKFKNAIIEWKETKPIC